MPKYDVQLSEPLGDFQPIEPGHSYPEFKDASWSGDADSPEAAIENARTAWQDKYGEDALADAEVKVTPGPNVCPRCEGRGKVERYMPPGAIDSGVDSPLGSAKQRSCPDCAGTGNITQRR